MLPWWNSPPPPQPLSPFLTVLFAVIMVIFIGVLIWEDVRKHRTNR